jgi:thiosulfate reductase cytochrome b subunit
MSRPLIRRGARPLLGHVLLLVLGLLALAGGIAAGRAMGAPASLAGLLAAFGGFDLPRWVHNLADLLQIITGVIAFLTWEAGRRSRRE